MAGEEFEPLSHTPGADSVTHLPIPDTVQFFGPAAVTIAVANFLLSYLPGIVTIVAAAVATFFYLLQIFKEPIVRAWSIRRKQKKIVKLQARLDYVKSKLPR